MRILILLLLITTTNCFGQIRLTGQVVDIKNKPLQNASVNIVGTEGLGVTDESGVFFLSLPSSVKEGVPISLRVSKAGYKTTTKHTPASSLMISIKLQSTPTKQSTTVNTSKVLTQPLASTASINTPTIGKDQYNLQGASLVGSAVGSNASVVNNYEAHLSDNDKAYLIQNIPTFKLQYKLTNDTIVVMKTFDSNGGVYEYELVNFLKSKGIPVKNPANAFSVSRERIYNAQLALDEGKLKIIIGTMVVK